MAGNRFLDEREAYRILAEGEYGFLSLVTPEGGPYGIPLNYVWLPEERCVFFHCAKSGRKLDCIRARPEVCFTVVGPARVIPERYNTRYESAVFTGTASIVTDPAEKREKLDLLARRFSPGDPRREEVVEKYLPAVCICKLACARQAPNGTREIKTGGRKAASRFSHVIRTLSGRLRRFGGPG
ncbi:MAG: pyridoxamine 5'-phosphate oxidase family protein [Anaerotruncus massiliensis (ex Togo et al. 2019)]